MIVRQQKETRLLRRVRRELSQQFRSLLYMNYHNLAYLELLQEHIRDIDRTLLFNGV
jgi:hypothetical protein